MNDKWSDLFKECSKECTWFKRTVPPHIPTPTCKVYEKYMVTKNPVTASSYRDILEHRKEFTTMGVCEFRKEREHDE